MTSYLRRKQVPIRDVNLDVQPKRRWRKKAMAQAISVALLGAGSLGMTSAMAAEPTIHAGDSYSLGLRDDGVLFQFGGNTSVPRIDLAEPITFSLSNEAIYTDVGSMEATTSSSDESNSVAVVSTNGEGLIWCASNTCSNQITAPPTPVTGSFVSDPKNTNRNKTDYLIDSDTGPVYFGGWDGSQYTVNQMNSLDELADKWDGDIAVSDTGFVFVRQQYSSSLERPNVLPITGLTNVKKATGYAHDGAALTNDGKIFTWYHDWQTSLNKVTQLSELTGIKNISGRNYRGTAVDNAGNVFIWKFNYDTKQHTITQITGLTNVKEASGSWNNDGSAVTASGGVSFWNWDGSQYIITQLDNLSVTIKEIVNGSKNYGAAITDNDTVLVWLWNSSTGMHNVIELTDFPNVKEVDRNSNYNSGVAVTTDNTIFAWHWEQNGTPTLTSLSTDFKEFVGYTSGDSGVAVNNAGTLFVWQWDGSSHKVSQITAGFKETIGYNGIAVNNAGTLFVWQWDGDSKTHKIFQADNFQEVLESSYSSRGAFVDVAGVLIAWQWDSTAKEYKITQITTDFKEDVISSYDHGLVLTNSGNLVSWQLDSTTNEYVTNQLLPDVKEADADGSYYANALAVTNAGTVFEIKYDQNSRSYTASQVSGLTDVVAVSTTHGSHHSGSLGHSLAMKEDGTLCGWGNNSSGQLGKDNPDDTVSNTAPVCNIEDLTVLDTVPKLATTAPPSICNGDSFDVTFKTVIQESQPIDTVTVNLGFDPAVLQINNLTNSGMLDFELLNDYDNDSIDFTAGVWMNSAPTQTFNIFTVNFTALQATETTLTYDTSKSSLISEGVNIPYVVEDGQLTISNCFNYQVDLQRKNPKPDSSWETALDISIGSQTNATKYTDTSDQNGQGNIAIEGTLGNEDYICVKNAHTLASKVEAPIDISTTVDFGLLLEGDANGDNYLTGNDLSLIFAAKKNYNPNADFDVSGSIEMSDALLLKANMGKTSACTWDTNLSMLRRGVRDGAGTVTLGTTAIPPSLTVGETFDYTILVQAGTQLVDTASAYLNFDSELLKVNTMLPGQTFDFVLQSSFDNELGNIDFAAGVWDNEVPKDTFTLVTINFTVLKVGGEETLSFNTTGNRATATVSGGSSVTAVDESGEPVTEEIEGTEPPTGEYTVYGTIRDELGNKLAGVEVQVAGKTVTTDDAGNWKVSNLQEGEYTVTASKDGYTFAPENVELGNDEYKHEVVIVPLSKLKVKVVAEPRTVVQNDKVTYIATVINGGFDQATGIVLTNVLPANAGLVSIEALDGGECDAETVTCTLPDLTTGDSARVKLVVSNTQAKSLLNTATVTTNEYPADVQKTRTRVIPHLAASITDTPEPLQLPLPGEERMLHYDVAATLSANAPTKATGVNLVMTLPKGVELQAINSDFGMCDTSELPVITCSMTDLSVDNADSISHVTVGVDVALKDAGLLTLTLEAKVSANEYPVHTDKERTKIFIDSEYKVDLALVIDDTGSMQSEINQVKKAMTDFIDALGSSQAPLSVLLTFGDQVKYRAVTQDMTVLRDAIGKLKASGGGTCPEASFEAISFAIPHVKEGGTILFATDASPYEGSDVDDMIARLNSNGIRFNAMVFGDCSDENSWNQPVM